MRFRKVRPALCLVLVWLGVSAASAAPTVPPNLAGSWVLNTQNTQRGQGFHRGSGGGARRPGGEPGEGGGGFGGGFHAILSGGNRGLGELLRPKQRLLITQTDTLLTVTDDAGWIRELIPSGQRMREELGQGGPAELETHWSGGKLIAERWLERGGYYKETYERDRKSGRLTVKVAFKTERMPNPIDEKRVYDPEPASP